MKKTINWGVLGAASIATKHSLPGINAAPSATLLALASRDPGKGQAAAQALEIPRVYCRYDELLAELPRDPVSSQYLGQDLISQVFHRYPQIAHLVPRDLLWFFGGDCLHFMPDEEITLYQALDERRFEAEENDEPFDWNQEKQLLALPTDGSKH